MPKKKKSKESSSGDFLIKPLKTFKPRPSEKSIYKGIVSGEIRGEDTHQATKRQKELVKSAEEKKDKIREYGATKTFIDYEVKTRFRGQSKGLPGAKSGYRKLANLWKR